MEKEKYYALCLEDYALPGFISGDKLYYGTLSDIDNFMSALQQKSEGYELHEQTLDAYKRFCNGNETATHTVAYNKKRLMSEVTVLGEKTFGLADDIRWTHINVYGYPYYMKADNCITSYVWLFDGARYVRCLKPSFENLLYSIYEDRDYTPISMLWGYPEIVFIDNSLNSNLITSRLFLFDRFFSSETEVKCDIQDFTGDGNYTEFCNEIFADG